MPSDRRIKCTGWILGIAIALATTGAYAATVVAAAPEGSMNVAANGYGDYGQGMTARTYTPLEAGVRKAAMQGPEALRRYIWRTRMIYDYYYPDWVIGNE